MPPRRSTRTTTAASGLSSHVNGAKAPGNSSSKETGKGKATKKEATTGVEEVSAMNAKRAGAGARTAKRKAVVESESDGEEEEVDTKPRRSTRASKGRKKVESESESEEEEDEPPVKPKRTSARSSKAKAPSTEEEDSEEDADEAEEEDEEEEEEEPPAKSRRPAPKSTRSKKPKAPTSEEEEAPPPPKAKRASTRSSKPTKAAPVSPSASEEDDEDEVEKATVRGKVDQSLQEEEEEEEAESTASDESAVEQSLLKVPSIIKRAPEVRETTTPSKSPQSSQSQTQTIKRAPGAERREALLRGDFSLSQVLQEEEGDKSRLVIDKIVLVNFKSYKGRQEIGPFHKSFSAIVGPNGSGKSNTIDALLFVFGFKATKMRQGKLGELIHNSSGKRENSCSVEVWFKEIKDLPGADDFEDIPGSELIVSRTAFKDNKSKYEVNGKPSSFGEVQKLLKAKGIDLDHKRFLILQGEVESIALMKPKGTGEHDEGLLEYLEDIIGTTKYKEPLEEALARADALNEDRGEIMGKVKNVEKEKSRLEAGKKAAEEFLRLENRLTVTKNKVNQVYRHAARAYIEVEKAKVAEAKEALDREVERQKGSRDELEAMQKEYEETKETYDAAEKEVSGLTKELGGYEKEEAQLEEKKRHVGNKVKKLKKTISEEGHQKSEALSWVKNHAEEIEKASKDVERYEVNLEKEETELDKIRESLKDKTAGLTSQIEKLQKELQPWQAKILSKKQAIDLAEGEKKLLNEKAVKAKNELEEAEAGLEDVKRDNNAKTEEFNRLREEKVQIKSEIKADENRLKKIQSQDDGLKKALSAARQKADEARASQAQNRSRGDVLSSLTKLRDQGRLDGFHGRLGHLGRIDDKYDVAVSTACPGLDNLVVDTVEIGQACLDHIRRNDLGRAVLICLNKLPQRNLGPIQTPENAPRLFDLVTPKDSKLAPAFYHIMQNTLVAKDLEQANRIAFGAQRWRVVTVDGKLIDTSGTMSGGGTRVNRGAMSSKFAADEVSPAVVDRLDKEKDDAEEAWKKAFEEGKAIERRLDASKKREQEIDVELEKLEMAMRTSSHRVEEVQKRIVELKQRIKPDAGDTKRIADLEKSIRSLDKELELLNDQPENIRTKIKDLEEKILEMGGEKLRSAQAKVKDLRATIDLANEKLTKAEVGKTKAEKDAAKFSNSIEKSKVELEDLEADLKVVEKSLVEKSQASKKIRTIVDQAKEQLEEKKEELAEMKKTLTDRQEKMNKFREKELKLQAVLQKHQEELKNHQQTLEQCQEELDALKLHQFDDDDDDEAKKEEGKEKEQRSDADEEAPADNSRIEDEFELKEYTEEELEEFDANNLNGIIAGLEDRISRATPNLNILKEYQKREREFLARAKDLSDIKQKWEDAKREYDSLRNKRLTEFMDGFSVISMRLKEMYQMITLGGNAELELVDSLDPFSEGIIFSVMPPKKSWKNIANLSGGEKTLSSLALVFALQVYKPTPLYFMDEIDAALDFRNVSIIAHYIKEHARNKAQFIIISLRNDMFELSSRLVGIYKTNNATKTICVENK